MATTRVGLYEGLFLLSPTAGADLNAAIEFLNGVFQRAEAEVLVLRKFEERKLAFSIRGQKRGIYVLSYFKARGTQIANIERDCNLSDVVTRQMIIDASHLGETEIELAKREVPIAVEAKLRGPGPETPEAPIPSIEEVPALDEEVI